MKKYLYLFSAFLLCFLLTGCDSKLPKIYRNFALECINGIGQMTIDEVEALAEENGYEFNDWPGEHYHISPSKGEDYVLIEVKDNTVFSVDFSNRTNGTSFEVTPYKITYVNINTLVVEYFDSLSVGEEYVFGVASGVDYTTKEESETSEADATTSSGSNSATKEYDYDTLQKLFIDITNTMTADELETVIEEQSLYFSSQEYNKSSGGKEITYVIAYTEGSAAQKYADSGDYLKVSFDKSEGTIMHAQYVNASCSSTALYYNYGTWYDFNEKSPGGYSGYYIIDPFSKTSGITIKYSNGNEKKTNYFEYDSAEKAIRAILRQI